MKLYGFEMFVEELHNKYICNCLHFVYNNLQYQSAIIIQYAEKYVKNRINLWYLL